MATAKQNPLILVLITVVIVLAGYIGWKSANDDCEKRHGPVLESRFNPLKAACEIKMGDSWKTEAELKNSVTEGVKEMQDGAKKAMQGILGK